MGSSDSAGRQAGQSSNMLKWMPREKKKDASVDISDDPLDALMFGKKDPHNKIYCVNRVNPLFLDDNPYTANNPQLESNFNRIGSFSSGYGSSFGKGTIRRGRQRRSSFGSYKEGQREGENTVKLPAPVWPSLDNENRPNTNVSIMKERFQMNKMNNKKDSLPKMLGSLNSLNQSNEKNEARSGQKFGDLSSKSPRYLKSLDKQKLMRNLENSSDELESDEETQHHEQTAVNAQKAKAVTLEKSRRNRELVRSTSQSSRQSYDSFFDNGSVYRSIHRKDTKPKKEQLQLKPNKLRMDMHPYTYLDQNSNQRTLSRKPSPPWLLARRPSLTPSNNPYTQFGGEVGWYAKSGGQEKKMKISSLVFFCKSVCFVLLLACLVMVVVTVSVFLTKNWRKSINV